MKKIYTLLAAMVMSSMLYAQNVSFSLKPATNPSAAKVYVKSNATISGVVTQTLLTFTLPVSVGTAPTPVFTLNSGFSHLSQNLYPMTTEVVNGVNSYVYTFVSLFAGTTTTTLTANVEAEFGEVLFNYPGIQAAELRLVNVPDGGTSTNSYLVWEVGGINKSNEYSICYGTGASNSASGYSGYSYVPLSITLPVKFLSFLALKNGDDAKLSWTVDNDGDNRQFEIERSIDGRNFSAFTTVKAFENGKSVNTYDGKDSRLSALGAKTIYYRIKQVDKSGQAMYSQIRTVSNSSTSAASIFPNPARTTTKLVVDAPVSGKASITLRDASGKQAMVINTNFNKGINQVDLTLAKLANGEYNIVVLSEGINQTLKLSKFN